MNVYLDPETTLWPRHPKSRAFSMGAQRVGEWPEVSQQTRERVIGLPIPSNFERHINVWAFEIFSHVSICPRIGQPHKLVSRKWVDRDIIQVRRGYLRIVRSNWGSKRKFEDEGVNRNGYIVFEDL